VTTSGTEVNIRVRTVQKSSSLNENGSVREVVIFVVKGGVGDLYSSTIVNS